MADYATSSWVGRIMRKKRLNRRWLVLAVLRWNEERSTEVYVARSRIIQQQQQQQQQRQQLDEEEGSNRDKDRGIHPLCLFINAVVHATVSYQPIEKSCKEHSNKSAGDPQNDAGITTPTSHEYVVTHLTLLQCAPDPHAVPQCIHGIRQGKLSLQSLVYYTGNQHPLDDDFQQQEEERWRQELEIMLRLRNENADSLDDGDSNNSNKTITSSSFFLTAQQLARIIRNLLGRGGEPRGRPRVPHTKHSAVLVLERLEQAVLSDPLFATEPRTPVVESSQWPILEVTALSSLEEDSNFNVNHTHLTQQPFNLPEASSPHEITTKPAGIMSSKGMRSRQDYLLQRKLPQITWMLERIRQILAVSGNKNNESNPQAQYHNIVDVGGGRGDLTVALAQAFASWPNLQITLVDCNASSLAAAQHYAEQVLKNDDHDIAKTKIHFVEADFGMYIRDASRPPPTLVVALHACGDLSDAALQYAVDHNCPFCICPCCYTKRYIGNFVPPYILQHQAVFDEATHDRTDKRSTLTILGRMAETDERPDLLRRAAIVFNSMRLRCIPDERYAVLRMEEYDPKASSRNLVLVGMPK